MFRNDRNPQLIQGTSKSPNLQKISDFSRALATNHERVYDYIIPMVKGDHKTRQVYSDFIFSHLRNIIANQINTNVLKCGFKQFITTVLLVGDPHLYEDFANYLLPIFKEKVRDDFCNKMKPIWSVQQFCSQIIFMLASWLPLDLYDQSKPSVFVRAVDELKIQCHEYRFINVDKLIISYRILKSIKLDSAEEVHICQKCRERAKNNDFSDCFREEKAGDKMKLREKLYLLQFKNNNSDSLFRTGFEIQLSEEVSQLELMLENRLNSCQGQPSLPFNRLEEKIDLLEDHLQELKHRYHQLEKKKQQNQYLEQHPSGSLVNTPSKKQREVADVSTAEKSTPRRSPMVSQSPPSTKIKSVRSLPNIQLLPLQEQFQYHGCPFFQNKLALSDKEMEQFKLSLLRFDQKFYLKKEEHLQVSCIVLARRDKIKIRVLFGGEEKEVLRTDVEVTSQTLDCSFDPDKYEFTIKLQGHLQPIEVCCKRGKEVSRMVLPLGYVKLLEPLPDSAKESEKLTFKFEKTVKLENKLVDSYQNLVGRLSLLEKTMEEVRSAKMTRLFEKQKLKRKLERRYLLLGSQVVLKIINHHTQYIEMEVWCLDRSTHRFNACQLMKELIFICSAN